MRSAYTKVIVVMAMLFAGVAAAADWMDEVEDHFADSNGVKIHYVTAGEGPLVLFIHGFPDFWYSWQHQMRGLSSDYRVAAMDTRGYNKSDKPEGVENYDMSLLVGDVAAVIKNEGRDKAVIVGHDWGGAIAWQFTMQRPEMVDKLIIVNLPHPRGIARELATNEEQYNNSQYARNFQSPNSHEQMNAEMLAGFVARGDADKRQKYVDAFSNSSFDAMMNYYRRNYPKEPYTESSFGETPPVTVPVLQFHGLMDTALHHHGLNNTWEWLEKDYTLVTLPGVGHWAHHEAADLITNTMKWWLKMRETSTSGS